MPTPRTMWTCVLLLCCAHNLVAGTVKLTFTNLQDGAGGTVRAGLFKSDGFPDEGREFYGEEVEVEDGRAELEFSDVPPGTYAIACYHDVNGDEECNRGLFGIPKEPYGFSNNVFARFGPPKFDDASFEVDKDETVALVIEFKS